MKRLVNKYMHTIDGKPAHFEGDQICFTSNGCELGLRNSLDQIRREQRLSVEYRMKNRFSVTEFRYGYIRVKVPA